MPLLAGLLVTIFSGLVEFFVKYFTKKVAIGAAAVATFAALTVALMVALSALIMTFAAALPSWPGMEIAVWVAVPPNLIAAISACIATDTAIALYKWNVENLRLLAYIT